MLLYCATRLQIVDRAGEMKVHCDENTVSIVVFRSLYAILVASIYHGLAMIVCLGIYQSVCIVSSSHRDE